MHTVTVLEWIPSQVGMEQELEVTVTESSVDGLLAEFNRQYGGGMVTIDGDDVTVDSTEFYVAWKWDMTNNGGR